MASFFEMGDIPKRGWTVYIDGNSTPTAVSKIEIVSEKYGKLCYGMRPEGYDGWAFREINGGGAVTIPYARTPKGELLVGLLLEKRPNMGKEPVWCAIGGFVDAGETHIQAQQRESMEESSLNTEEAKRLNGKGTNSNRAFFVADAEKEGVVAFRMFLPFKWLKKDNDGSYKIKGITFEKSDNVRLFPWREAINISPDALARSAIAQLLSEML